MEQTHELRNENANSPLPAYRVSTTPHECIDNKPATEILKLAILSHYIEHKEDKSVSVALIAEIETDKTRSLKKFYNTKGVAVETDLTYMGLINHILPQIETGNVKTIVIPDMIKTVMKKQSTVQNFIGILNSLMEEGVHQVTLKEFKDFRGARANLLTSMTPALLNSHKLLWNRMGFLSRFLPFTYSYTESKTAIIHDAIAKGQVNEPEPVEFKLPEFPVEVELPKKYAEQLYPILQRLTQSERARQYKNKERIEYAFTNQALGFRHQHQLQALLRASAFSREDTKVTQEDVKKICWLGNWINYDYNVL